MRTATGSRTPTGRVRSQPPTTATGMGCNTTTWRAPPFTRNRTARDSPDTRTPSGGRRVPRWTPGTALASCTVVGIATETRVNAAARAMVWVRQPTRGRTAINNVTRFQRKHYSNTLFPEVRFRQSRRHCAGRSASSGRPNPPQEPPGADSGGGGGRQNGRRRFGRAIFAPKRAPKHAAEGEAPAVPD